MDDINLQEHQIGHGLSSLDAVRRLRTTIRDEIEKYQRNTKSFPVISNLVETFMRNKSLPIDWFWACLLIAQSSALLFGYVLGNENDYRGCSPLLEGLIAVLFTLVVFYVCLRENSLLHSEVRRSLMDVLERKPSSLHQGAYLDIRCPTSPAISVTWTYRDNTLVNLPWNLLVEGDCIVLGPSDVAPANIKQVVDGGSIPVSLDAGEIFNPPHSSTKDGIEEQDEPAACFPYPRQKFIVQEAPIKRCIRSLLQHGCQRPQSILNHDMKKIMTIIRKKLLWFFLISTLFVNYVRFRLEPSTVGHYSEIMILATAYVIIPLSPIIFPVLWFGVSLYGVALINYLFKHPTELNKQYPLSILKEFWCLLRGDPSSLPRTANLLHTLGSVSVFCCIDKVGVLCYPNLTPGNVFFFKDIPVNDKTNKTKENEAFEISTLDDIRLPASMKKNDEVNDVTFENDQTEVLNISYDFKQCKRIQFDDVTWNNYIDSLKPLGLNIMLNSSCCCPLKCLQYENLTGHVSLAANSSPIPFTKRCMCPLAKEMGFENKAMEGFIKCQQIFSFRPVHSSELSCVHSNFFLSIVKEKPVPSMVSVVVKDKSSGMLQLLSQGSADIVLDACSDYWNGDDLCELSAHERRKALDFYQRMQTTGHCVAFSYQPLIDKQISQAEDIFIEYPSSARFSTCTSELGSCRSLSKLICKQDESNCLDGKSDFQVENLMEFPDSQDHSAKEACDLLNKQIFMGIVTLHDLVKEDIACLVENLNNGGVRFVYFSYENELRSRIFAERLGLETGWNCHISLGSSRNDNWEDELTRTPSIVSETEGLLHGSKSNIAQVHVSNNKRLNKEQEQIYHSHESFDANSAHEDFYLIPNRAKLPRGIRNIRPHLKHVDNVPLLVPLFTDCSPQAIADMIEIMQENGEVVCCLGSSLNIWNCHIFSQADISIAVDPLHPQLCMLNQAENFKNGEPLYYSNFDISECETTPGISSLQMSSLLNGLGCSFSCKRDDKIKFISVICEARRMMFNVKSCFLFFMSCYLSLSLLMLTSFCMLLPFPLTGLQLFWLTLVIIPILSLSLIATPADAGLMNQMTGKRISNIYEDSKQYLAQFLPTFGLNSIFTVAGLFAWMLFEFCVNSHGQTGDCHYFLGARNLSEPWHGWSTINKEGLFMSQDLTLLFTTINFSVLSASFVHRTEHLWRKSPFDNSFWTVSLILCFLAQVIYTSVSLFFANVPGVLHNFYPKYVTYPLLIAILWPAVLLAASELMKKRFMKMNIRFQKRERLKFDTKLGMNSPV